MIYLDYSATTNVNDLVLEEFIKYSNIKWDDSLLLPCCEEISSILNTNMKAIITSGSTESNNLAIKGILNKYNKPMHIITTKLEHSSVNETLKYYESLEFIIDYVNLTNGIVDLNHFKSLLNSNVALVTISSVNSETGLIQPINDIGKLCKDNNIIYHCDMTQSIGKIDLSFDNIDLITFSSHKIYGLKGVGVLLNNNIDLLPILYGERTYNYALIKSFILSLKLILKDIDKNYEYVLSLNKYIKDNINKNIIINSNSNCIPHILNISFLLMKPETFMHSLELNNIYISTKSACSKSNDYSTSVYALTNDIKRSSTSVRISLSHLTTKEEIDILLNSINNVVGGFHE